MADIREKLIELIQSAVDGCATYWAGLIADHLIANGVTVQKWIAFDDVKPKDGQSVLGITTEGEMETYYFYEKWECCLCRYGGNLKTFNITHWMPLPEPPRGEENHLTFSSMEDVISHDT